MKNELFLEKLKPFYDSLKYFDYKNGYLILRHEKELKIPLIHTNLANLANANVFLLSPAEIFQVIYVYELLYLKELSDTKINFLKDYTNKYLEIDTEVANNQSNDQTRLDALAAPIHLAYSDEFINNPASKIIIDIINNYMDSKEKESGRGNNLALVLSKGENQNFDMVFIEDPVKSFKDAGFTTIILITSTIILTCLYIAFFIVGN